MKTLSPEEKQIREVLIEVAKQQKLISYTDLCVKANLPYNMADNPSDRAKLGGLLGDISEFEYENGRPMLSAVCRTPDRIGGGFFEMASWAIYGDGDHIKQLKAEFFDMAELNNTYEYWRKVK
ncbi:MAG: hypothetical protein J6I79_00160 [Paludibacteraceae bacterium]|nr:hypothetical protein [Paludibacteraceae bacterium]MBP3715895.1 hypothetical protein [Paludibacteraceae bacterium]